MPQLHPPPPRPGRPATRVLVLLPLVLVATLALAACGDDTSSSSGTTTTSSTTAASSGAAATVAVSGTNLGKVLVDADGRTLYAFTPDTATRIACTGACAQAWPPAIAPATPTGDGVTAAITVVARPDGTSQVVVGGHPLYRYVGDAAAGDTNGQGSGGKWFVVAADGSLVEGSGSATTTTSTARSGY